MNYNKYMTVETTFMDDCPCFSFQSNKDIQNWCMKLLTITVMVCIL